MIIIIIKCFVKLLLLNVFRTDVSEGIDFIETSARKECIIFR